MLPFYDVDGVNAVTTLDAAPAKLDILVPHTCAAAADGDIIAPSIGSGPKS